MRFTALETYDADWLEITPLGDVEVVRGVAEIEDEEVVQYLWSTGGWNIVDGDVPEMILDGFDGDFPYVSRWYDTDPDRPVDVIPQIPLLPDPDGGSDADSGNDPDESDLDADDESDGESEGGDSAQPPVESDPAPIRGRKSKE